MNKATTEKHQQIIYKSKTKNKTPALKIEDLEPSEKTLATSLMSMPQSHMVGKRTNYSKLSSDFHMCACTHVHIINKRVISENKFSSLINYFNVVGWLRRQLNQLSACQASTRT